MVQVTSTVSASCSQQHQHQHLQHQQHQQHKCDFFRPRWTKLCWASDDAEADCYHVKANRTEVKSIRHKEPMSENTRHTKPCKNRWRWLKIDRFLRRDIKQLRGIKDDQLVLQRCIVGPTAEAAACRRYSSSSESWLCSVSPDTSNL